MPQSRISDSACAISLFLEVQHILKYKKQEKKCHHKYREIGCNECLKFQKEKARIKNENTEKVRKIEEDKRNPKIDYFKFS